MNEPASRDTRLAVLDGWRGVSILAVLATHLLPLGPKSWQLNETFGPLGMALFFTLSGFLITRFLLHHDSIGDFLIRRFFRVIPLAWLAMLVALTLTNAPGSYYLPNFLFYANLPPQHLTEVASHLWSLCVEMQFYVGIAFVVGLLGRRGLFLIPAVCLAVTVHRIWEGAHVDVVTWRRVDEILAGAMLAMAFEGRFGPLAARCFSRVNAYVWLVLLVVSSHPAGGFMNYLRPYIAAMLVGATLFSPPPRLSKLLQTRSLAYIATISYALYIIHHLLVFTWLGEGERLARYLKKPLLIAASFALAHVSTFYFEHRWIAAGKRLSALLAQRRAAKAMP